MMVRKFCIAGMISAIMLILPVVTNIAVAESPVQTVELISVGNDGKMEYSKIFLTPEKILRLKELINKVILMMSVYRDAGSVIEKIKKEFENIGLGEYFNNILKTKSSQSSGFSHKRVLILSNGYGKRIDFKKLPKVKIFKPFTFWFYFGVKNYMDKSKTVIIDLYPPNIKVLRGWQFGVMRRFVGLYIKTTGSMFEKDHVFFIGYAYKVTALDIPDPYDFIQQR